MNGTTTAAITVTTPSQVPCLPKAVYSQTIASMNGFPDTYTVALTVTDDAGESDAVNTTATIGPAKQPIFLPWLPLLLGE